MAIIHQYIKNRKGQLIGCVAAVDSDKVGYSLCNTKAGDKFNKAKAFEIAVGRAIVNPVRDLYAVPRSAQSIVEFFLNDRAVRYFKNEYTATQSEIKEYKFKV